MKNFGFRYCATPIIITSMPMVATYRVKVEWIILFAKIMNTYFESKECFLARQFWSFYGGSVRIKGAKTLYLPVRCSFKAYCKLHRLAFTWLDAMLDIRESQWLVKNLFWPVNQTCLEPCTVSRNSKQLFLKAYCTSAKPTSIYLTWCNVGY